MRGGPEQEPVATPDRHPGNGADPCRSVAGVACTPAEGDPVAGPDNVPRLRKQDCRSARPRRPTPHAPTDPQDRLAAPVESTAPPPLLTVRQWHGAVSARVESGTELVLLVQGEVDIDSAVLLRAALVDAVANHRRVCCDLGGVTFFGAAGVTALVMAHNHATLLGSRLYVRGAQGLARRVLRITGLDHHFQRSG